MSIREVVRRCEGRFGIQVIHSIAPAGRAQIFLAARSNEKPVLKIGLTAPDVIREVYALRAFAGRGVMRLIDYDDFPAILLQRTMTGYPLPAMTDEAPAMQPTLREGPIMLEWPPVLQPTAAFSSSISRGYDGPTFTDPSHVADDL